MSAPRIPDFYIVGHGKSGTTAMYEMLRRHPQIYMPDFKEPGFFAQELFVRTPPRPEGTPQTLERVRGLVRAGGARPARRRGRPLCIYGRGPPPRRIAGERPDARIIAIFREPASFLHSLHLQFLQMHVETESDFARAIELEESRRDGRDISALQLLAPAAAVLRARPLRRAAQALRGCVLSGADQDVHLRRLPRRQRGDDAGGARASCASTSTRPSRPCGPIPPSARARSGSTRSCTRSVSVADRSHAGSRRRSRR